MPLMLFAFLTFSVPYQLRSQCACTAVLNPTVTSEFGAATSTTGYCKKISGTFLIDHDFEFISSNLEMQPGSEISIAPLVTLTLNDTKVFNCSTSWKYIRLNNSLSGLVMNNNSEVTGADVGVYAPNGGNVLMTDSKNTNNVIGMDLMANAFVTILNSEFVAGGVFGIQFWNPSNGVLTISRTKFSNYAQCVYCRDGSMMFSVNNVSEFNSSTNAILLYNIIGTKTIQNSRFNDLFAGVDNIYGTGVAVNSGNIFTNVPLGVYVHQVASGSIDISGNTLTGSITAIRLFNNDFAVPITVNANTITDAESFGITYQGQAVAQTSTTFSNNTIDNFVHVNSIGIKMVDPRNVTGYGNHVFNSVSQRYCLLFEGGQGNAFYENFLNTEPYFVDNTIGISIFTQASQFNLYRCNRTNNREFGFRSTGASDFSTLRSNDFATHTIGLQIDAGSKIGVQPHFWNRWSGTYSSGLGAVNSNTSSTDILASRFTVGTPLYTVYHPANSGSGFFDPMAATPPSEEPCNPETGGDEFALRENLSNSINWSGEYQAVDFDSRLMSYRILEGDPQLRAENQTYEEFYSSNQTSTMGKFVNIEKLWKTGNESTPVSKAELANKLSALTEVQISYQSLVNQGAAQSDIQAAWDLAQEASAAYSTAAEENHTYLLEIAAQAKAENELIECTQIFEQNIKEYNDVFYQTTAISNSSSTEQQKATLLAIAVQCPLQGGKVVYLARALYNYLAINSIDFDDEVLCNPTSARLSKKFDQEQITIRPNPAQDLLQLDLTKVSHSEITVNIISTDGKVVISKAIEAPTEKNVLDISSVRSGFYFIQFLSGNKVIYTEKLSVIKK